jgi:catechol 2,3-dioxygenase-like lactoylglutathione lyase family enzyme
MSQLSLKEKARRKLIGAGGRAFFASTRLRHRWGHPGDAKLKYVDHVTIRCSDLSIAERFYVDVLGARIVLRLDAPRLQQLGWSRQQIEDENAVHLSLTLGGGPRIELFQEGDARDPDSPHPHMAFAVSPDQLLRWKKRLTDHGVTVAGPCRLGPPGQASCYFQDPFGNQFELVTLGFTNQDLPIGPPPRTDLAYNWPR